VGAVFGAGAARKMGPLTIAPEFRYTRWAPVLMGPAGTSSRSS
jgi:hypothetical protein